MFKLRFKLTGEMFKLKVWAGGAGFRSQDVTMKLELDRI